MVAIMVMCKVRLGGKKKLKPHRKVKERRESRHVLRKAKKPQDKEKRDRQIEPLQRQAPIPNGSGVSHPSPSEMWLC